MTFFQKIWHGIKSIFKKLFSTSSNKNQLLEIAELPSLPDISEMENKFDIYNVAEEQGQSEQPETSRKTLDDTELSIKQYFVNIANEAKDIYHARMTSLVNLFPSNIPMIKQEISTYKNRFQDECDSSKTQFLDNYKNNYNDFLNDKKELEDFKKAHNITRNALQLKWGNVYGLLIFVLAIEVALNTYFFSEGSSMGLLGGFMECIIIALVNVIISFFLGNFTRKINSAEIFHKVLGFISLFFALVFPLVTNTYFSHYRELYISLGRSEAVTLAFPTMFEKIISTNLESILFFIMGVIFGYFAVYKGYHSDDPIPNYSKISAKVSDSIDNFNCEKEEITEKIQTIYNLYNRKIDDQRRKLDVKNAQRSFQAQAGEYQNKFIKYMSNLEDVLNQVITSYRNANKSARTTKAPAYFGERVTLPSYDIGTYLNKSKDNTGDYEDAKASIGNTLANLTNDTTHVLGNALDTYSDTVERQKEKLTETQDSYNSNIDKTTEATIDTLGKVTNKFSDTIAENTKGLHENIEKSLESSVRLNKVFDEYINAFDSALEKVTKTEAPNVTLQEQLTKLFDELASVTAEIKKNNIIENAVTLDTASNIKQINEVINNFNAQVDAVATNVMALSKEIGTIQKPLEDIGSSINGGMERINSGIKKVEESMQELSSHNSNVKEKINKDYEDIHKSSKQVNDVVTKMNKPLISIADVKQSIQTNSQKASKKAKELFTTIIKKVKGNNNIPVPKSQPIEFIKERAESEATEAIVVEDVAVEKVDTIEVASNDVATPDIATPSETVDDAPISEEMKEKDDAK